MAMQSGNAMAVEKMHAGGSVGGGNEVMQQHQGRGQQWWHQKQQYHQSQHFYQMDERDGFISWIRGEFAAANAMIDALCNHLRLVGEPGEYDGVIGCIQQRRCNWSPVLHMQQYFSVAEVVYELQQMGWRRQHQHPRGFDGSGKFGKEYRRGGGGRGGPRGENFKEGKEGSQHLANSQETNANVHLSVNGNENLDCGEGGVGKGEVKDKCGEEKKEVVMKLGGNSSVESTGSKEAAISSKSEHHSENVDYERAYDSKGTSDLENDTCSNHIPCEKQNHAVMPKTFVANEIFDGKMINVVDGMKLYEEILNESEVLKLTTLVNDLRAAGRKGQFQGHTFVVSKRPMKGHGREMIQFGLPITDAPPEDDAAAGNSKDQRIEGIPGLFQDVIERLIAMQVISVKPDSCIIDIFNEGDHSQPHMWPHWFGRPVSVLFLTECEMAFGKVIGVDHPGDFKGSLKLSLTPGSMLAMQGRSADFAKHAIPSLCKQRILVTFTKSQPKRTADSQRLPSSVAGASPHWVPPPSRSPNHSRHAVGPKHYGLVPTTGVLPAPNAPQQLPPPNGIQPIFVPAPVAPGMPFPAPVALPPASAGWPAAPPRHPPPRLPVPGTGVFLPPSGSGSSSNQSSVTTSSTEAGIVETSPLSEKDNTENINGNRTPPEGNVDEKVQYQECNGSLDGTCDVKSMPKGQQHQNANLKSAPPVAEV